MLTHSDHSSTSTTPLVRSGLPVSPGRHADETSANRFAQGHGLAPTRATSATAATPSHGGEPVHAAGQPLPTTTRQGLEGGLGGFDLGQVRIHTDRQAQESARSMNAKAYTVGRHIVFDSGRYDPSSGEGQRLLRHEAAHVVQQAQEGGSPRIQREPNGGKDGEEDWVQDRGGALYYATKKEAEARKTKLADDWKELRVVSFKLRGKTYWRVEMRGRKKSPKEGENGKDQPDKQPKQEPKERNEEGSKTKAPPSTDSPSQDKESRSEDKDTPSKSQPKNKDAGDTASGDKDDGKDGGEKKSSWTADKTFDKKEDADKRREELVKADEWKEIRVVKVEETQGSGDKATKKTRWRVETRGKLTLGSKTFALTFDDGPHSAGLGKKINRTEKVLDTLDSKGLKGKAAFFVQTGVAHRGASKVGAQLIQRMFKDGHEVGIHTGGINDHESHVSAEKAGRLEQELKDAKAAIKKHTGVTPPLVRAPFGKRNAKVEKVYAKLSLKHLFWDIDGDQGGSHGLADLKKLFDKGLGQLKRGAKGTFHNASGQKASPKIVVLYHDIRKGTANNIGGVIDHIRKKVPGAKFDKP